MIIAWFPLNVSLSLSLTPEREMAMPFSNTINLTKKKKGKEKGREKISTPGHYLHSWPNPEVFTNESSKGLGRCWNIL